MLAMVFVTLNTATAGREIVLGTETAGKSALNDVELDYITAGVLKIGGSEAGDITVTETISPENAKTLSLETAGAILDGNGDEIDFKVDNLAFRTGNGIGSEGDALETQVKNLAFANTGGGVGINDSKRGTLAINSVDGLASSTNTGTWTSINKENGSLVFEVDTLTKNGFAVYSSIPTSKSGPSIITVKNGVTVSSGDTLRLDANTINLDGNLTAKKDIFGTASVVNIIGSTGDAEIQDGVDVAETGATVNVGEGNYDGGITVDKTLTLLGEGRSNSTIINVADNTAGLTITANNVTVDGFHFDALASSSKNTGIKLGEVNVSAAVNTTIQNNTFNNLHTGVYSALSDGTTTISNNIFTNIKDSGIEFGHSDAVTAGESIVIADNNVSSTSSGLRFASTIKDAEIAIRGNKIVSTSRNAAITFDRGIKNTKVTIGGVIPADANNLSGARDGIKFNSISGGEFNIIGNKRIVGNSYFSGDGIEFNKKIKNGAVINIANNQEITGGNNSIAFYDKIDDSKITIAGNKTIVGRNNNGISFAQTVTSSDITIGEANSAAANSILWRE